MSKDPHIANIFSAADDDDCLSLEQLTAYQEGRVQGQERNRMERHLLDCELCAITLESVAEHGAESIQAGAEEVSEQAWTRLEQKEKRKRRGAFFWIAAAASVAIIITVGFFTLSGPSDQKIDDTLVEAQKLTPPMGLDSQTRADIAMAETDENYEEAPEPELPIDAAAPNPSSKGSMVNSTAGGLMPKVKPMGESTLDAGPKGGMKSVTGGSSPDPENDNFADGADFGSSSIGNQTITESASNPFRLFDTKESIKTAPVMQPTPSPKSPTWDSKNESKSLAMEDMKKSKERSEAEEKASPYKEMEAMTTSPTIASSEPQLDAEDGDANISDDEVTTLSEVVVTSGAHRNIQRDKMAKDSRGKVATVAKGDAAPIAKPNMDYYTAGMAAYQQANYREAAANLRTATELTPTNLQAHLYAADAFLRISQPQAALFHCERILSQPGNSVYEDAEWFKALAYLQLKEGRKAKSQLEAIVARNGKYKARAEEALNTLK